MIAIILLSISLYVLSRKEKSFFISQDSLQKKASSIQNPNDMIKQATDQAESWSSIEKRITVLESKDEVAARIQLIDSLIESKQLIRKVNNQQARANELVAFTELVRERSLLYKRKIELDLSDVEKGEL